jgi:hypothetical protein
VVKRRRAYFLAPNRPLVSDATTRRRTAGNKSGARCRPIPPRAANENRRRPAPVCIAGIAPSSARLKTPAVKFNFDFYGRPDGKNESNFFLSAEVGADGGFFLPLLYNS